MQAGVGTFGKVMMCHDTHMRRDVAIKVVRRIRKYTESARIEAEILEEVNRADPSGASLVVRMYHSFEWHGHYCMVFEPLGPSVYDYVKLNEHKPLPLTCVQSFSDQLLTAVAFIHEMRLIHTDLKLENILLCCRDGYTRVEKTTSARNGRKVLMPKRLDIKLIDFGGATYDYERKSALINTRQYRSPEVILGLGWSIASDVWGVGCILMELYTGELLFQTHDNMEHLALIEAILGPFPTSMILRKSTKEVRKYFNSQGKQRWPDNATSRDSVRRVRNQKRLSELVNQRDTVFMDLVRQLLRHDPAQRITAREALNHRFFTGVRGFKEVPRPAWLPPQQRGRFLESTKPRGSPGDERSPSRSGSRSPSPSASPSPSGTPRHVHAQSSSGTNGGGGGCGRRDSNAGGGQAYGRGRDGAPAFSATSAAGGGASGGDTSGAASAMSGSYSNTGGRRGSTLAGLSGGAGASSAVAGAGAASPGGMTDENGPRVVDRRGLAGGSGSDRHHHREDRDRSDRLDGGGSSRHDSDSGRYAGSAAGAAGAGSDRGMRDHHQQQQHQQYRDDRDRDARDQRSGGDYTYQRNSDRDRLQQHHHPRHDDAGAASNRGGNAREETNSSGHQHGGREQHPYSSRHDEGGARPSSGAGSAAAASSAGGNLMNSGKGGAGATGSVSSFGLGNFPIHRIAPPASSAASARAGSSHQQQLQQQTRPVHVLAASRPPAATAANSTSSAVGAQASSSTSNIVTASSGSGIGSRALDLCVGGDELLEQRSDRGGGAREAQQQQPSSAASQRSPGLFSLAQLGSSSTSIHRAPSSGGDSGAGFGVRGSGAGGGVDDSRGAQAPSSHTRAQPPVMSSLARLGVTPHKASAATVASNDRRHDNDNAQHLDRDDDDDDEVQIVSSPSQAAAADRSFTMSGMSPPRQSRPSAAPATAGGGGRSDGSQQRTAVATGGLAGLTSPGQIRLDDDDGAATSSRPAPTGSSSSSIGTLLQWSSTAPAAVGGVGGSGPDGGSSLMQTPVLARTGSWGSAGDSVVGPATNGTGPRQPQQQQAGRHYPYPSLGTGGGRGALSSTPGDADVSMSRVSMLAGGTDFGHGSSSIGAPLAASSQLLNSSGSAAGRPTTSTFLKTPNTGLAGLSMRGST